MAEDPHPETSQRPSCSTKRVCSVRHQRVFCVSEYSQLSILLRFCQNVVWSTLFFVPRHVLLTINLFLVTPLLSGEAADFQNHEVLVLPIHLPCVYSTRSSSRNPEGPFHTWLGNLLSYTGSQSLTGPAFCRTSGDNFTKLSECHCITPLFWFIITYPSPLWESQ